MSDRIKTIIFDWSGTISDDRRPVYEANQRMSAHWGVPLVSFEAWLPKTTLTVYDYFHEAGVTATDEEIWSFYRRTFDEVNSEQHLPSVYADAHRAIERLQKAGATLAVVSAHPQSNLMAEANRYGLASLFELITGDSRDKREGIQDTLKILGAAREHALYIGDTNHDMRHAKSVPVLAGAITTGYHTEAVLAAEKPDYIFHSLTHVADTLITPQ